MMSKSKGFNLMDIFRQSWIIFLSLYIPEGDTKIIPNLYKAVVNEKQNAPSSLIPCENGWFLFGDKCYRLFDKTKGVTWNEAKDSCSANQGSLVSIHDQELQDFLATFLILEAKSNAWIGLHDRDSESEYMWEDGSPVDFRSWEPGEPTGWRKHEEDCVEMRYFAHGRLGQWNDLDCNEHILPYICQSNKNEQNLNHDPRFCTDENDGAWSFLESCYHVVDEKMTWDDAESYCQNTFQGHLLTILHADIETFLKYALSNFKKDFWIGLKISDGSKQVWTSGWQVTEGIHYAKGTCVYMSERKSRSSYACDKKLPFVCEVPKDRPPVLEKAPEGWKCPDSSGTWVDLGGEACYIFETNERKDWYAANFECTKKGGNLASIHSTAESIAIQPHVIGQERVFIGLHRSLKNHRVFEWVDGSPLDYHNLKNGDKESKCGELWTKDMTWRDVACDVRKGYICSTKKVPPPGKNESNVEGSQHLVDSDSSSSGNVSSSTILVATIVIIAVLLATGFTIYFYKNYGRKSDDTPWTYFTFSRKNQSGSEFQRLNTKGGRLIDD